VNNISELLVCRNYSIGNSFRSVFPFVLPKALLIILAVDPYAPQATDGDARRPFSNIANVRRPRPLPPTVGAMEDFTLLCIISILYCKYIIIMYYIINPLPNIYTLYYSCMNIYYIMNPVNNNCAPARSVRLRFRNPGVLCLVGSTQVYGFKNAMFMGARF